MKKIWSDEAWDDYVYWQNQDKKTLKKINRLLQDISEMVTTISGSQNHCQAILRDFGVYVLMQKIELYFE